MYSNAIFPEHIYHNNGIHLKKKKTVDFLNLLLFIYFFFTVVLGKVRSAVGSAQLLMSQKFQQFRGLCEQNLVCILSLFYTLPPNRLAQACNWRSQLVTKSSQLLYFCFFYPLRDLLAFHVHIKAYMHRAD